MSELGPVGPAGPIAPVAPVAPVLPLTPFSFQVRRVSFFPHFAPASTMRSDPVFLLEQAVIVPFALGTAPAAKAPPASKAAPVHAASAFACEIRPRDRLSPLEPMEKLPFRGCW